MSSLVIRLSNGNLVTLQDVEMPVSFKRQVRIAKAFLKAHKVNPSKVTIDAERGILKKGKVTYRPEQIFSEEGTFCRETEDSTLPTVRILEEHFFPPPKRTEEAKPQKELMRELVPKPTFKKVREAEYILESKGDDFEYEVDSKTSKTCLLRDHKFAGRQYVDDWGNKRMVVAPLTPDFFDNGLARAELAAQESYCYSGKTTSDRRLKQTAEMAYKTEAFLHPDAPKGVQGEDFYFFVHSLETPSIWARKEKKETEQEALLLSKEQTIEVNGKTIRLHPIFINTPFNASTRIYDIYEFGKERAERLSKPAMDAFKVAAEKDSDPITGPAKRKALEVLQRKDLSREGYVLTLFHLYRLFNLPIIIHCKKLKNRSGIAIAMLKAFDQWQEGNSLDAFDPEIILNDENFKKLFLEHFKAGLMITKYATGTIGYELNVAMWMNPMVVRLAPESLTEKYNHHTYLYLAKVLWHEGSYLKSIGAVIQWLLFGALRFITHLFVYKSNGETLRDCFFDKDTPYLIRIVATIVGIISLIISIIIIAFLSLIRGSFKPITRAYKLFPTRVLNKKALEMLAPSESKYVRG